MSQEIVTPVVLVKNEAYWLPYALEASRGFFSRYVIYDVGSCDNTTEIIDAFQKRTEADFFVRKLPHVDPRVQGVFRNSMIAEARSPLYFILDGDEVYSESSYRALLKGAQALLEQPDKLYGIVRRIEVGPDLRRAWGTEKHVPHHRLYRREAIWRGPHPGEAPFHKQRPANEMWIEGVTCYHFHNTARSPYDDIVPGRLARRGRTTYRPGDLGTIDLLGALPLLRRPVIDCKVSPALKLLH